MRARTCPPSTRCASPGGARSAPIGSTDAHDAFDHAEKAVLAIHNRRETDKWELRDPDSSPRPPRGPWAAGVPCLALPPKLEGSAPNVADHLVPKTDELREVRSMLAHGSVVVHGAGGAGLHHHRQPHTRTTHFTTRLSMCCNMYDAVVK